MPRVQLGIYALQTAKDINTKTLKIIKFEYDLSTNLLCLLFVSENVIHLNHLMI
jgi:hypothetical protein